jgi:hypothetical protein
MSSHRQPAGMTRSQFLSALAGLGVFPLRGQNRIEQPFPNGISPVASGSLLLLQTQYADIRSLWNVDPKRGNWCFLASGYDLQYLLSADRSTMYLSSAGRRSPYLQVLDLTNRGPSRTVPYPGSIGGIVHQMGLSADDKYIFVLTDGLGARPSLRDTDYRHTKGPLLIYTYDIARGIFLPEPQKGPFLEDISDAFLIPDFGMPEFPGDVGYRIFDARRRTLWMGSTRPLQFQGPPLLHWELRDGRTSKPWPRTTQYRYVWCPSTRRAYFIYADGDVVCLTNFLNDKKPQQIWSVVEDDGIDGIAPNHVMAQPAVSTDGSLLFVPVYDPVSSSTFMTSNRTLANRISVYRIGYRDAGERYYFKKIQEIFLDKVIKPFQVNADGTEIYTWDRTVINTKTQQQREWSSLDAIPSMSVTLGMTVVP